MVQTHPTDLICGFSLGFFSLFLFQLWLNKSFPELTHVGSKNRNAASTVEPAKLTDSQSQGRKYPRSLPLSPIPEKKSPCDFRIMLQAKF